MERKTEAEVISEVKALLIRIGLKIQRINTGCFKVGNRFIRTASKGTLDFEGYDNKGRFVGIECKRPSGGRISPEQAARIKDINDKGGIAGVVTSAEQALELLKTNKCL